MLINLTEEQKMIRDMAREFTKNEIEPRDKWMDENGFDFDLYKKVVDAGFMGVGRLVANHQIKKFLTSHIGLNPLSRDQMFAGEMEVEFIPQGTFAERIRAGGYGLGGVLTPTGVGTDVAKGKQIMILSYSTADGSMPFVAD